jgi:hypothetical protein
MVFSIIASVMVMPLLYFSVKFLARIHLRTRIARYNAYLAIMIFLGIFEFIVAIVSSAYCCKAVVCCGSVQAKQHQDMELRPPTENKVSMKPRWSVDFGIFNERSQRKKMDEKSQRKPQKEP